MKRIPFVVAAVAVLAPLASLAVVPEFYWTGNSIFTDDIAHQSNWRDDTLPEFEDGTSLLNFSPAQSDYVYFSSSINLYGLKVSGHYHFIGDESSVRLGAGGLDFSPINPFTHLVMDDYLYLELATDQTWTVTNGSVEVHGGIYGTGNLTKAGAGRLLLSSDNSNFSGGITLNAGSIEIVSDGLTENSSALGTGTLTIGAPGGITPPTLIARYQGGDSDAPITINNSIVVNGVLATKSEAEFHLAGDITLNTSSTFTNSGETLFIDGAINEASAGQKLTVDAASVIVLTGSSGWSGGTQVNKGIFVFDGAGNLPTGSGNITVGSLGYVGITDPQGVPDLLSKLDAGSSGTIGFDSDPNGEGQSTFDGTLETPLAIDLTGFHSELRLGTATQAILGVNTVITPQGDDYRFGGGGGILTVATQLTGTHGLVVDSPDQLPLTVRLLNQTNNFTGNVSVTNSGLIFTDNQTEGATPLPAGTFTMNAASYIGHEDPHVSPADFFAKFAQDTHGIIGFDLAPDQTSTRVIDFTGVQVGNTPATDFTNVYLGTSSFVYGDGELLPGVRFTGTIEPNSNLVHRFAAYKGGFLEIAGTLTGSAMVLGEPFSLGAFGDRMREQYSTILLTGDNAGGLSGGVSFYGGQLMIGQSNGVVGENPTTALGSGALGFGAVAFEFEGDDEGAPAPLLSVAQTGIIVPNAIALNTDIEVGGNHDFTLTGNIVGTGELYVGGESEGPFTLTLSGNNSFSGGVYVSSNTTINANSNSALGSGPLAFGSPYPSDTPMVNFSTTAPSVGGLTSQNYALLDFTADDTVFTVNQPINLEYGGTFRGLITGVSANVRLVKEGPGMLRFEGNDDGYNYGFHPSGFDVVTPAGTKSVLMEVRDGTLSFGPNFYIADYSSFLWVNGGALTIDSSANVYNPILVTSGTIGGNGYLDVATLAANAKLAPGFGDGNGRIGTLTFNHVTFGENSVYEWDIASAENSGQRDLLVLAALTTLEITGTDTNPWIIRPVTLSSTGINGLLGDLTPGESYSWKLIEFNNVTGIAQLTNPTNVSLDLSGWQSPVPGNFELQFTALSGPGELLLNFTAIPEPSTYALIALGLGFVGVTCWRRRRAA